ncbi:hypothetical protein, partial [Pseudomonas sp.]|uniref:hypothetical protein n=1 Tax=Pseudomonas sp. TaxID=306 RepID=UPI003BB4BC95
MSEANSFVPGAVSVSDSDAVFIETERLEVEKILPHALADFGGALSWPIPLSVAQQKEVLNAVKIYVDSLGDIWTPGQGLLEHLNLGQPLTREILQEPARALPALIATARGQALGLAVQTHLNGIATEVSVNEYALAALQLSLDPLSIENPRRNWVAGFDLADKQHWGRPLSAVFNKLREHLITELFSTPEMARLGAYLLLARNAPLYLIKDLPVAVNYGGLAWFNLAVAALTIEAQSPGKVANLNFAQVMICAESAALVDPAVTRHAQTITLIDWGVVQGWVARRNDENYTEELLESLKTHFNDELTARLNTSILLSSEFPSRLEIARAGLKKQFGEHFPIESHVLEWDRAAEVDLLTLVIPLPSATLGPVGKHTLLDVAMMDGSYKWKTTDPLMKNRIHEVNELNLHVRRTFKGQFETTLNNLKEGARLKVQHLISGLPLEDRENLEHGKIDFYQRKTFRLSTGFWGRNEIFTSRVLRLRVERGIDKKVSVYSIDLAAGSITQLDSDPATETEHVNPQAPSIVYATTPFYLADKTIAARLKQTNPSATTVSVPTSYSSVRTHTLANAFVEHLDYDSEDIFNEAEGQTTYDKQLATLKSRVEFLLNLIPFKSAISHFAEGKYLDGAIDLFLDVLGFVTAGAGAATKLAKVATSTASAISKALRAAKIVGMLIIGELNPLSGLPALAVAGRKLLNKGISFAGAQAVRQLDKLRGTPDGFKFLQTVAEQHGPALIGTFKVGDQAIDGVGVLKNDSWYQYNLNTRQLYGPPRDFTPQGVSWGGILGREANARVYVNFHHNIEYAKDPRNIAAFELGYREGRLLDISDYRPKMKFDDLIDLASQPGLMPAEIGALTKEIK